MNRPINIKLNHKYFQTKKYSNTQILKHSNTQTLKYSNTQILKHSNIQILKQLHHTNILSQTSKKNNHILANEPILNDKWGLSD
jgi:hypothetical protein